jgi:ligand-binding sensor domain-containing protein
MRYVLLNLAFLGYVLFGGKPESPSAEAERLSFLRGGDTLRFENASRIARIGKKEFVITSGDSLYFVNGNVVVKAVSASRVSAMLFAGDTLWVGSAYGLFYCTNREGEIHQVSLPARDPHPMVNDLARDAKGRLWIATERYGLFALTSGTMRPYETSPEILCVVATPEGSIWAGSNIGLFHIFPSGEMRRYNEEISGQGITIPDNIVEKLEVDAEFMSSAASSSRGTTKMRTTTASSRKEMQSSFPRSSRVKAER